MQVNFELRMQIKALFTQDAQVNLQATSKGLHAN